MLIPTSAMEPMEKPIGTVSRIRMTALCIRADKTTCPTTSHLGTRIRSSDGCLIVTKKVSTDRIQLSYVGSCSRFGLGTDHCRWSSGRPNYGTKPSMKASGVDHLVTGFVLHH